MPPNTEQIARGSIARHLQVSLADKLFDMEYKVMTSLIERYKRGDLTDLALHGGIGEIAGLRDLARSLETDIRRGDAESQKEYGSGPAEEIS